MGVSGGSSDDDSKFALVILNSIVGPQLPALLRKAALTVCADGGSNRLYDNLPADMKETAFPDAIVGDLDSARAEVLEHFARLGTRVVRVQEQDTCDMEKALRYAQTREETKGVDTVVVYGAFGGRFDQEMAAVQVWCLSNESRCFPTVNGHYTSLKSN